MAEDGFFSRWSRRKAEVREGRASAETPRADAARSHAPAPQPSREPPPGLAAQQPCGAAAGTAPSSAVGTAAEAPPPSLADALALPAGADVRAFMARNVAPEVRAAAVKKLFADPHFNLMDGLDVYIDDYNRPSPLPAALLREMQSARALGLFDAPQEPAGGPVAPVADTSRVDAYPVIADATGAAPSELPAEPSASFDAQPAAAPDASRSALPDSLVPPDA